MNVLVIGGTRNVGRHVVEALLAGGHTVTTFNRGRTPDHLPEEVERLHGDRTDPAQLARAIGDRSFDGCVDTIAMRGGDTAAAIDAFDGRVGHYVHISTGQVYLVRDGCPVPAREEDYDGPIRPPPAGGTWEEAEWRYGIEKRECEDLLDEAWASRHFPATRLRLPMIHGPRDHHRRIEGYVRRLTDGGPLLVPLEGGPRLRHVHADDVAEAIVTILEQGIGAGRAYNLASDDLWLFADVLDTLADALDLDPDVIRIPRDELVRAGVFPACSPLSNPWMSLLDPVRAREELDIRPAGFGDWLAELAVECRDAKRPPPDGYAEQRAAERALTD